jgi:hypothetical protein
MNIEDLTKATEVLTWLAARFAEMPENRKVAAEASFVCNMAGLRRRGLHVSTDERRGAI